MFSLLPEGITGEELKASDEKRIAEAKAFAQKELKESFLVEMNQAKNGKELRALATSIVEVAAANKQIIKVQLNGEIIRDYYDVQYLGAYQFGIGDTKAFFNAIDNNNARWMGRQ